MRLCAGIMYFNIAWPEFPEFCVNNQLQLRDALCFNAVYEHFYFYIFWESTRVAIQFLKVIFGSFKVGFLVLFIFVCGSKVLFQFLMSFSSSARITKI